MTAFLITSHANGGIRALTMKGDGEDMIEFERRFARDCGTDLIVMHEFEVSIQATFGQGPGLMPSRSDWDEAKRVAEAFWAGHDAPRIPGDWRGCPVHQGSLHERVHVLRSVDIDEPVAVVLDRQEEIARLTQVLSGKMELAVHEVPVLSVDQVIEDVVNYGRTE